MAARITAHGAHGMLLLLGLAVVVVACMAAAPNYPDDTDDAAPALEDYTDTNDLARYINPVKRACVRRGGNCDHRPNDCCYNSSCRCNLWGANCRCQRMGLFQKWG